MKKKILLKVLAISLVLINLLSISTPAITELIPGKHSDGIKTENREINHYPVIANDSEKENNIKKYEKDYKKIFEKFYRDKSEVGGHGIGLAIVKKIVGLHDGKVEVESQNGLTKFTVILPNK